MNPVETIHERYVRARRVDRLCRALSGLLSPGASVLDVGCGDGRVATALKRDRPDLEFQGIDVLVRPGAGIPVTAFDGHRIPFRDNGFDIVMMVDVIHHAAEPVALLREAGRVAKKSLVLKDHLADGLLARSTLRFMDEIGNRRHGVALPHDYWVESKWHASFMELGLGVESWSTAIGLYPWPASWVFERRLHFLAKLVPSGTGSE